MPVISLSEGESVGKAVPARGFAPATSQARPRRVLVANGKGGCGKTTLAINIAGSFAAGGRSTALLDYDPQGSSLQWLSQRKGGNPIHGVAAHRRGNAGVTRTFLLRLPTGTERVVLDAPAGIKGMELVELVREVDTIVIPVLPSPIDMHAAAKFIQELLLVGKVRQRSVRVGVVANRVAEQAPMYAALERFVRSLSIPFVAKLRESACYLQAAQEGRAVSELGGIDPADLAEWQALMRWVESD
jgi:chromosome partitioning protein